MSEPSYAALAGPLLIAHRGASREQVENTLPAFRAALELGADVIESDVFVTRDDQPVLCHDSDGLRLAGDARAIAQCSLEQIARWELAAGRHAHGAARVATLDEVLAQLPDAVLNLDLKQHDLRALPCVLELIARHHAQARVLLTSFSSRVTARVRALGYRGPTGLGRAEAAWAVLAPPRLARLWPLRGARLQIPTRVGVLPLARSTLIDKLRPLDIAVDYWVINDPAEAEHLLALGAQGIVTDDVRAMAALFARSPCTQAWRSRHPRA